MVLAMLGCNSETETISVDPNAPLAPKLAEGPIKNGDNGELIESVQMDWKNITYKGEAITIENPVLFFADGMACVDSSFLSLGLTRAEYQAQSPMDFRPWRRNNEGDIEMKNEAGTFAALASAKVYRPSARGEVLSSRYSPKFAETLGETSEGTLDLVYDGSFTDGKGNQGSYLIEGYLITLKYDDGTDKAMTLIIDPDEPRDIWLNNEPYHADTITIISEGE